MSIDSNDRSDSIRTRRREHRFKRPFRFDSDAPRQLPNTLSRTHCRRVGASREDRSAPAPAPARDTTVDLNESAPRVGGRTTGTFSEYSTQARSPQFAARARVDNPRPRGTAAGTARPPDQLRAASRGARPGRGARRAVRGVRTTVTFALCGHSTYGTSNGEPQQPARIIKYPSRHKR